MSPYTRGALFLIRLIGAGFIVFSITLLASDLILYLSNRPVAARSMLALKCLPLLIGIVICWKSYPMARSLTRDLDDEVDDGPDDQEQL